jgi:hypothetical protein
VFRLAVGLEMAPVAFGVRLRCVAFACLVPTVLPAGQFVIACVIADVVCLPPLGDSLRLAVDAGASAMER